MNLDAYIEALQALVPAEPPDLGDENSVLSLLYEAMNGMPPREMDQIVHPVCTFCRSHQKSGFIEGVRIGFRLAEEFTTITEKDH